MSTQLKVKPERLGFRDENLSAWHRSLGYDFPATDLDFLLCEYDRGEPKAIIEFKMNAGAKIAKTHPSLRAVQKLCDRADLPFFVVRYAEDLSVFRVIPMNSAAMVLCPNGSRIMSDEVFKRFLERIRH